MDIIQFALDEKWQLKFSMNPWVTTGLLLLVAGYFIYSRFFQNMPGKSVRFDGASIGIGAMRVNLKPNNEDIQIAYKIWVELSTRKIGLPIDLERDILSEVYNSWFEFFRLTRELIKNIPATKIRSSKGTMNLVDVAIGVLNDGLRPHLTDWQGRFRDWYKTAQTRNKTLETPLSPQELQKTFPEYESLVTDLTRVNQSLINYRELMRQIYKGD